MLLILIFILPDSQDFLLKSKSKIFSNHHRKCFLFCLKLLKYLESNSQKIILMMAARVLEMFTTNIIVWLEF